MWLSFSSFACGVEESPLRRGQKGKDTIDRKWGYNINETIKQPMRDLVERITKMARFISLSLDSPLVPEEANQTERRHLSETFYTAFFSVFFNPYILQAHLKGLLSGYPRHEYRNTKMEALGFDHFSSPQCSYQRPESNRASSSYSSFSSSSSTSASTSITATTTSHEPNEEKAARLKAVFVTLTTRAKTRFVGIQVRSNSFVNLLLLLHKQALETLEWEQSR